MAKVSGKGKRQSLTTPSVDNDVKCVIIIVDDIIVVFLVFGVSVNALCMAYCRDIISIAVVGCGIVLNLDIASFYTSVGTNVGIDFIVDAVFNILFRVSVGMNSVSAVKMTIDTNVDGDCIGVLCAVSDGGGTVIVVFFAVIVGGNCNNIIVSMIDVVGVDHSIVVAMMNRGAIVVGVFKNDDLQYAASPVDVGEIFKVYILSDLVTT